MGQSVCETSGEIWDRRFIDGAQTLDWPITFFIWRFNGQNGVLHGPEVDWKFVV